MLRVLQEKEIERVGGTKVIPVDIRLITATNRNLEEMARANQFRRDLWFRLNVFPILIPPLRERKSDIPEFVDYFLFKKSRDMKLSRQPKLAPGTINRLLDYDWPGNVRELENVIERALILNRGETLVFADSFIPKKFGGTTRPAGVTEESQNLDEVVSSHIRKVLASTHGRVHGPDGAAYLLGVNPSTLRKKMSKLGIDYGREFKTRGLHSGS
jgi:transcriptional regulator with GAF, ATPase, and Fis domain